MHTIHDQIIITSAYQFIGKLDSTIFYRTEKEKKRERESILLDLIPTGLK